MTRVSSFLTFALCLLPFALVERASSQTSALYNVHAVRFATLPAFRVSSLVADADRSRTLDIAMMVWVLRSADRIVLVDAGFYRDKFMPKWKPAEYVRPSEAVRAGLGIAPEQVTDIIVSHVHWDHLDGADLFPRAKIWIQREEHDYYVGPAGEVRAGAIDADDARMLTAIAEAGRLQLVDGDDREILPGIRVYTGGKHTYASQYVGARTRAGTVILASDNAYLFENLEKGVAIAATLDRAANVAAQARMLKLAATPKLVIPGHDPAVFERFPLIKPGVARIDQ
ncbi:MAG TPA: N-acyl homoserine lactonase family protein [Vicinamibacterales bacterium]|nr:N-acyl homoserine lactonase family protein [Vicinamibacterales bacterium]